MAAKVDLYVELNGKKVDVKTIETMAKSIWKDKGNKMKDLASAELYYQPDSGKCYYVFNGKAEDNSFFEV